MSKQHSRKFAEGHWKQGNMLHVLYVLDRVRDKLYISRVFTGMQGERKNPPQISKQWIINAIFSVIYFRSKTVYYWSYDQ